LAELQEKHDVTLHWLPYELRPEPEPLPPTDPESLAQSREKFKGGAGLLAERYGVEMRPSSYKPRSRWAHEAAEFARDQGQFDEMREALFRAQWVDDRNIGDLDVLADLAAGIGLDGAALRAALEAGTYTERVKELEQISWQLGVRAVPTMIFGDTIAVQGAQPYDVLRQAIVAAERTDAGGAGDAVDPTLGKPAEQPGS
jgi:predicted DsbA family dithiol-disulfide isomerase